jgi:hypothetical protein
MVRHRRKVRPSVGSPDLGIALSAVERGYWLVTRVALAALVVWSAWLCLQLVTWPAPGIDRILYMAATDRWLSGQGFYLSDQLAGPYAIHFGIARDPLYPPLLLYLTVPFRFLPPFLWWAVPIVITVWSLIRLHPAPWTWPIMLGLLVYPLSWYVFFFGGPSMWVLAFAAAGAAYGWPGVFVLIKPTLAPFALFGVRRRSWWITLAILALACLPFGLLWVDWLRAAVINPTNDAGILYSLRQVPLMMIPLVAWLGRRDSADPQPMTQLQAALHRLSGPSP